MDATELALRRAIERLGQLIEDLDEGFDERVRRLLVEWGVIEGAAEDE